MKFKPWRWLRRTPGLLAGLRPEPAQQTDRISAIQRKMVLPAKVVIIWIAFDYIFYSRVDKMETTYSVALETMQNLFGPYVLINVAVAMTFLIVRRFPHGLAQWLVFVVGLVDGLFLAGLTVLTGGFDSVMYWMFAGMIVVNAICIPLATPQIVLNLALSACFLAAGLLEAEVETSTPIKTLPSRNAAQVITSAELADLGALVTRLRRHNDDLYRIVYRRLSDPTKQRIEKYAGPSAQDPELKGTLLAELNRILPSKSSVLTLESEENPSKWFLPQLGVLWLLTFCCYGVQLLAAQQRQALEEQQEFLSRTGQLRAAGRLAAEIAHKLKNPLGIINNAAYSLQRAVREGRSASPDQLSIIQEEVERSDRIITQVMGYSQLAEGQVEKLEVAQELERVIEIVFPPSAGFAVEVKRQIAPDLPPLWMQRGHFSEIFVNVLQNAREILNGVGQVVVIARPCEEHGVEVIIEDNGPGIPADKVERIFEPYFSMREKGTGLGLAIVRHNVELYAGSIRAESELGKGARFRVIFPARSSLEAES